MLRTTTLSDSYRVTEMAAQPARRIDDWFTATAIMLTILSALPEGLAAHRRYEHLRSEGVHHDLALRQALGISPPAASCST
jgi:hypothetical protein